MRNLLRLSVAPDKSPSPQDGNDNTKLLKTSTAVLEEFLNEAYIYAETIASNVSMVSYPDEESVVDKEGNNTARKAGKLKR
jgi:hypothetical protein